MYIQCPLNEHLSYIECTLHVPSNDISVTVSTSQKVHSKLYGVPQWQRAVLNVPPDVQSLLAKPVETLVFRFLDPVYCLLRLLTASPLAAVRTNLFFGPEPSPLYHDFCHGERLQRIYDALTPGTHALTYILFFDAIWPRLQKRQCISKHATGVSSRNG